MSKGIEWIKEERAIRRAIDKAFSNVPVEGTITVRFVNDADENIAEAYRMRNTPLCMLDNTESETAKIRKHNHDTLWAVLAGFASCVVLVTVFGLIIIGILSYARG